MDEIQFRRDLNKLLVPYIGELYARKQASYYDLKDASDKENEAKNTFMLETIQLVKKTQ